MPIRILIVDDSTVFRTELRRLLETQIGWEVCGEARDGEEGVEKNRTLQPHLIIMDFTMPRMSGIEAATEILKEFPGVPVLLLTLYYTQQLSQVALKTGIRATLSKSETHRLVDEIKAILHGREFAAAAI